MTSIDPTAGIGGQYVINDQGERVPLSAEPEPDAKPAKPAQPQPAESSDSPTA